MTKDILINLNKRRKKHKTKEKHNIVSQARWLVDIPSQIPEDYHFEQFSTVTVIGTALAVAYRIDTCLRIRSIVATFNTESAEAKCKTSNFMMFFVRLYQGPKKNTIVVEVQRWSDCDFDFPKERNAIFEAAKGGYGFDDSDMTKAFSSLHKSAKGAPSKTRTLSNGLLSSATPTQASKNSRTCQIISSLDAVDSSSIDDLYTPMTEYEVEKMLKGISFQIASNHLEVQLMALQSLSSMTDTQESHLHTSLQISQLILEGRFELRERVVSLIRQDLSNSKRNRRQYDVTMREQISLSSLQVMYNALESVSAHSSANNNIDAMKTIILEGYSCFSQAFLINLIEAIRHYEMCHRACLAVKCLTCLLRVYPELRDEALRQNVLRVLRGAECYGHECHLNLESESSSAINIMKFEEGLSY